MLSSFFGIKIFGLKRRQFQWVRALTPIQGLFFSWQNLVVFLFVFFVSIYFSREEDHLYIKSFIRRFSLELVMPCVETISQPVVFLKNAIKNFQTSASASHAQDEILKAKGELLKWKNLALQLRYENQKLKELAQVIEESPLPLITAKVKGSFSGTRYKNLLVLNDPSRGITVNTPVLAYGAVIGRAAIVGKDFVDVCLITHPQSKIPVRCPRTGEHMILSGTGTPVLEITYRQHSSVFKHAQHLSSDEQLVPGDILVTSGLGGIYPFDQPVAKVIAVEQEKNGKQTIIMPFFDVLSLEYIQFVLMYDRQDNPLKA